MFIKDKEVTSVLLDPMKETADINTSNNYWPKISEPGRFTIYKLKQAGVRGQSSGVNPMQATNQK